MANTGSRPIRPVRTGVARRKHRDTPRPATIVDTITGQVTANGIGGIYVNFDNAPQNFTFTGGSFDFFVNDVSLAAGDRVPVTGTILTLTAVPEPETYALFMAGLAAVGLMARRRKT